MGVNRSKQITLSMDTNTKVLSTCTMVNVLPPSLNSYLYQSKMANVHKFMVTCIGNAPTQDH